MPRGQNNGSGPSLRITDFSDRELLAIAKDLGGAVEIDEVAIQIWPRAKRDMDWLWHGRRSVAIRFAHMSRLGVIERGEVSGTWELTQLGRDVVRGKALERLGEMYDQADDDHADLMRREFQFRVYRRRWGG